MWSKLIQDIIAKGWSEYQIAARVGVRQPTINRLKLGRRKQPMADTGQALLALHKEVVG